MRSRTVRPLRIAGSFATAILACFTFANPVTKQEAIIALNGMVPDGDMNFLAEIDGLMPGSILDYTYTAAADENSWLAALTGTYAGKAVSISYSGNLSSFDTGLVTYASVGSYGADTWSGTGSGQFTETLQGFEVGFHSVAGVGSDTAELLGTTHAIRIGPGVWEFAHLPGVEDGNLTLNVKGKIKYDRLIWTEQERTAIRNGVPTAVTYSDFHKIRIDGSTEDRIINEFDRDNGWVGLKKVGQLQAVPEPGTLAALAGALLFFRRRRRHV